MKVGDVYYEKHTVVGISKRTNTVSETKVEVVDVLPIDVLDQIRAEIDSAEMPKNQMSFFRDGIDCALRIIDKYMGGAEE